MPPLIAWAAASGRLTVEAWIIYVVFFLWQFPHFMAIAWMYREDYDRAGYLVLPSGRARVSFVTLQTILPLLALLPGSLLALSGGQPSIPSRIGTLLPSVGFVYYGAQFVHHRSNAAARRLLLAYIIYVPLLSVLVILARGWGTL
jgi:protoheme IX farnesyltransferase